MALYEAGGCPYSESIQTTGFGACPQPWLNSSTGEAGKAKVTSSPWNCLFGLFFFMLKLFYNTKVFKGSMQESFHQIWGFGPGQ